MDNFQIIKINKLTQDFYSKKSEEFSSTRQNAWQGWIDFAPVLKEKFGDKSSIKVLDVGCGNVRFAKFLSSVFPDIDISYTGIDVCESLQNLDLPNNIDFKYQNVDFIESLVDDTLKTQLDNIICNNFDLVVSFGVMHHIPTLTLQSKFVCEISSFVNERGLSIFSYWRFMNDKKIAQKAKQATDIAQIAHGPFALSDNDYFLNWAKDANVVRFCHNFTLQDIEHIENSLNEKINIKCVKSFISDGKNNDLNYYSIYCR